MQNLKKVLVTDWLDKYGGAERVIQMLQSIYRFDITYALINIMKPEDYRKIYPVGNEVVKQTPAKIAGSKFRLFFFLFHNLIDRIKIDEDTDIILSSSHAVAKGVNKSSHHQLHISYFQARNFKHIWDEYDLYFGKLKFIFYPFVKILRNIDVKHAQRPDHIISNSVFVQKWVKEKYNRDSVVIYPPVDLSKFTLQANKEDYYVAVGRLVAYKRFDLIVKAFNINKKKLIIIGDGDQFIKLKKAANANIEFKGYLQSDLINQYIQKAKCFIHAGIEDFGIAPLEAQACGTPVIAYGKGGVLETIINYKTGILFESQTVESLNEAVSNFNKYEFDPQYIRKHALNFSAEKFEERITDFVKKKWDEFKS